MSLNELPPSLFDVMYSNEELFCIHKNESPNTILKKYAILDDKGSKTINANFSINFSTCSILRFEDAFWLDFINSYTKKCKNNHFKL